jgi:AraC family transcriptional regulator
MTNALKFFQGRFGRVALLDSDHSLVTHAHPQCHVLIKARGEDTAFEVGDRLHPLTRDTAILVNAWEPHAKIHERARRSTVLALYIEPDWLATVDRRLSAAGLRGFFPRSCVAIPRHVRLLADRLIDEMYDAAPDAQLKCAQIKCAQLKWEGVLSELMTSVLHAFSAWRDGRAIARANLQTPSDPRIGRAIRFMHENLGGGFSFDDVARASHLSRPHFFYMFKRCTAVSPAIFFNTLRMESAFSQLTSNATTISSVASRLGFSEPHHFTRFFRQNLGIPPSEYRNTVELFH